MSFSSLLTRVLLIAGMLGVWSSLLAQDTLYTETFDENGVGAIGVSTTAPAIVTPPSNGQWSVTGDLTGLTASSDYFQVENNVLEARDVDAPICFESSSIDITNFTDVSFSVDIAETGDHEASDFINVEYSTDGGATFSLIANWQNAGSSTSTLIGDVLIGGAPDDADFGSTTVTQAGLSGSSLVIRICVRNNSGSEFITLDNVVVTGTPSTGNSGPTTLVPGDLAIVRYVADNPDEVCFVLLKDINAGTEISFTDNGWQASGSFRSGEGFVTWTAPQAYSCGDVVCLIDTALNNGSIFLSTSGDQIFAFQGSSSNPTLLYGIQMNGAWDADATSSNTSALPAALINGFTANDVDSNGEVDNAYYNEFFPFADKTQALTFISDDLFWGQSNSRDLGSTPATFTINDCNTIVFPSTPTPSIVINEINFNGIEGGTDTTEFVELFNADNSAVDISGWVLGDGEGDVTFPANTVMAPGSYLVIAERADGFENKYGCAADFVFSSSFALSNSGEAVTLVDGNGDVVDEVDFEDSDSEGWVSATDGNGPSLELVDPASDNSLGANWAASVIDGGTPGAANQGSATLCSVIDIVINEINYNGPEVGTDTTEFIELFNNGNVTVNLEGWFFTQGFDFTFPAGASIAENEYIVIAFNGTAFTNAFGFAPDFVWTSGGLSNGGEDIELRDAAGNVQDFVDYDDFFPWPQSPDGNGPTLELNNPDLENNDGNNWSASIVTPGGTPGALNSTFVSSGCGLSITGVSTTCETATDGQDTYTAIISYETTGFDVYFVTPNVGTLATNSDDPSFLPTGNIIVEGIQEGTDLNFFITSGIGGCNTLVFASSPVCVPPSPIVINEINYNGPESGTDSTEFIELFNTSSDPVDLSGYSFSFGVTFTFPAGATIDGNSYVVVVGDSAGFRNAYGCNGDYWWNKPPVSFNTGLSNSGERITLVDASGVVVDEVTYDDFTPWTTAPDGNGPSLELLDPLSDNALASSWVASVLEKGTPGAVNQGLLTACPPVAPSMLTASNDTELFIELNWMDNSNTEADFVVERSFNGGAYSVIATLPANTTAYTDTILEFGFPFEYRVFATNVNGSSDFSNTATASQPANIIPLELSFDCYDPATDMLNWIVNNPNTINIPYIYAQWYSPQRDTLLALPGASSFMTMNNLQNPATLGDDNITGVWWVDERLLPGVPNDIVFTIDLAQTCGSGSRNATPPSPEAPANLFSGQLAQLMATNMDGEILADMIHVAPNPFQSTVIIEASEIRGNAELHVFDLVGREVYNGNVNLSQRIEINLSDLNAGVYILEVRSAEMTQSFRLIKE